MIGVVYGGDSFEHEVSISSAEGFCSEIDARKFYLSKKGIWFEGDQQINDIVKELKSCDVVFPLIHGSYGENGTFQGFLEMNDISYAGCGVDSSAICMDKDLTKRILESHNIKTTPFRTYFSLKESLEDNITLPCVVKASSLGSSFGVYKVEKNLEKTLRAAFNLSSKILVEELVSTREIWVSVLQEGEKLICSPPCEFIPKDEIFTYENKYTKGGATYHFPAQGVDIDAFEKNARKTFKVLGCRGMARIDFFLRDDGEIIVNEVNTVPGFTPSSLYPKALITGGISYKEMWKILKSGAFKPKSLKNGSRNFSSSEEGMLV